MNYWLDGENPGSYHHPTEWKYVPCIRNDAGKAIWEDPVVMFSTDLGATQYAKRVAHRRWVKVNGYPLELED